MVVFVLREGGGKIIKKMMAKERVAPLKVPCILGEMYKWNYFVLVEARTTIILLLLPFWRLTLKHRIPGMLNGNSSRL